MIRLTASQAVLAGSAAERIHELRALKTRPFKSVVRLEIQAPPSSTDPLGQGTKLLDFTVTQEMVNAQIDADIAALREKLASWGVEIVE